MIRWRRWFSYDLLVATSSRMTDTLLDPLVLPDFTALTPDAIAEPLAERLVRGLETR